MSLLPETAARLFALYPVLAALPGPLREAVVADAQQAGIPAGAVLFDQGSPCAGFPLVVTGEIRVAKTAASGRALPLYRVTSGESCILTSSCLLAHITYTARGVAATDLSLVVLPGALFRRLIDQDEGFRQYVFSLFAERMSDLLALVEAVAFQRLDQRLAALLLGHGKVLLTTHQALADELGSVREIVTRLLHGFVDQGLVSLGRERIELLDPARLRALADGQPEPR